MKEINPWLKSKGYLHMTSQVDVGARYNEILRKVKDPNYVARYAFYPLLHAVIKERRYKKIDNFGNRAHSYKIDNGEFKRNTKSRPLHYATHMDAIIFGYYAELLQNKYEEEIQENPYLHDCIIAYRKLPISQLDSNKSTIHFASEVFREIRRRSDENKSVCVLTFDIKQFFPSLDHKILKKAWGDLFGFKMLPADHYNVFKAATKFSYILLEDLKVNKRAGFDEKKLSEIRNNRGFHSFFDSPKTFREEIKTGNLKIHKYPFRNRKKEPVGIPQGLPISAILANLYLLSFDIKICDYVANEMNCYYRRYSDDIVIVCSLEKAEIIKTFVEKSIEESKIQVSTDKTEHFIFEEGSHGRKGKRLVCYKIKNNEKVVSPLTYLGFEFNGKNILIKSANLAKFYRRMISAVKRKCKRAHKIADRMPGAKAVIFKRQLYKLYTTTPVNKTKIHSRWKKFVRNEHGEYRLVTGEKTKYLRSNYLTYVKRASQIADEPAIKRQIRNHKKKFHQAIVRHLFGKEK